jgi:hypothetical protein
MGRQSALKWVQALLLFILPTIPIPADSATVAHWMFLEGSPGTVATGTGTILDSSGNNLNGTPFGGPAYKFKSNISRASALKGNSL